MHGECSERNGGVEARFVCPEARCPLGSTNSGQNQGKGSPYMAVGQIKDTPGC